MSAYFKTSIALLLAATSLLASISAVAEPLRVLTSGSVNGQSYVITVREHSHVLGQKFQVELRYSCDQSLSDTAESLPVQDSFSVCDLSPGSVTLGSSATALAVKTKAADLEGYYEQIAKGDQNPILICQAQTEVKKFSLKTLCQ
jgi:hypothetical protein